MAHSTSTVIDRQDLVIHRSKTEAIITDAKHLASYNWIEAKEPTIAVPGCPARWNNIELTQTLSKDQGLVYIAQNAARHPDSPLEPLFRALWIENPSYDIRQTDMVTDRNNIRKLLSFIDDTTATHGRQDFAIRAEAIANTVVLDRIEVAPAEHIGPDDFRGYGHAFEKAYTTNQIACSTGHHRVTTYQFGGLSYVIRYEADGYQADGSESELTSSELRSLDSSLSQVPGDVSMSMQSKLVSKRQGTSVPNSSIIETKTRVAHKPLSFHEVAAQLWISQTPKLVRAYHTQGTFEVPYVENVVNHLKDWETRNQSSLRQLAALMAIIREDVLRSRQAVIRYTAQNDRLEISAATFTPFLPQFVQEVVLNG